ncbi:hypothetical protein H4R24_000603 [Coemansia sp. RSA 988]|nr:hypothetical protein H4R24_000603 [Coemansia sp. RSA 988]
MSEEIPQTPVSTTSFDARETEQLPAQQVVDSFKEEVASDNGNEGEQQQQQQAVEASEEELGNGHNNIDEQQYDEEQHSQEEDEEEDTSANDEERAGEVEVKAPADEESSRVPSMESASRPDMNNALARARAIAAKLGSMQQPTAQASAGDARAETATRGAPARRSASPDAGSNDRTGSRGHKRDWSDEGDGPSMGRQDSRRRMEEEGGTRQPVLAFPVPSQLSGLIIGRNGNNLRSIEQRHGVRIQFDSNDRHLPERQVSIEGPVPATEAARQDIMSFIDRQDRMSSAVSPHHQTQVPSQQQQQSPPAVTIMVPSSKVGLIIGRGGESIKDIQFSTSCGVQVQPDDGRPERPIRLLGTPEQVDMARARIMDIVAERASRNDSGGYRSNGMQPSPPQMGFSGRGGGGYPMSDGRGFQGDMQRPQQHMEELQIPAEAVGVVIGRGGETIKYLQQSTGTKIQVIQGSDRSGPLRPVTIEGDHAACMRARSMIEEKIESIQGRQGGGYGERRPGGQLSGGQMGGYDRQQRGSGGGAQPMYGGGYGQPQQQQMSAGSSGYPGYGAGTADMAAEQKQWGQQLYSRDPAAAATQQNMATGASYGGYSQQQPTGGDQQAVQWTNQQTADYYSQYAATSPEYAQYAEYYRKLAEKDPNGIVPSGN